MTQGARPFSVVYFGTPEYAVPALDALAADARFSVTLVVTQPDRRMARSSRLQPPPVKEAAERLAIPVYQPESLRTSNERAPLEDANADLFVVAAYGVIFGPKTLALPAFGCVNLHASLLPKYRGASPISAAILAGDAETGVTLMRMDRGMDTGSIIAMQSIPIGAQETTGSLTARLANVGAQLAIDAIPRWLDRELVETPQPAQNASLVRPLVKADGWIDWAGSAGSIERLIRAMQPWPRAWTTLPDGSSLQILAARIAEETELLPGHVAIVGKRVLVGAGNGTLELVTAQPAGSGPQDAYALAQGRRLYSDMILGATGAPVAPPTPMIQPAAG